MPKHKFRIDGASAKQRKGVEAAARQAELKRQDAIDRSAVRLPQLRFLTNRLHGEPEKGPWK